ncbi:MAG: prepilin-type N-terminal cleavage/methylation domain-containing protein [Nitrospirae bacterium]|nr:prepilin-type N-terminal cleavage/methylation domain-containing protein [Candidatus Manganitrophaceae bacterium]
MDTALINTRARMKEKGFTLLEMMVGVAILGVLVSIAIPNYLTWNARYEFKDTARILSSNIMLSRVTAMSQNTTRTITLSVAGDMTQYNSFTPGLPNIIFPSDVSINNVLPMTVGFNAFGQKTTGGAGNQIINIDSASQPNTRYVLTITPAGKITIVVQNF